MPQILLAHVTRLFSLPRAYFNINHLLPGLSQWPPTLPRALQPAAADPSEIPIRLEYLRETPQRPVSTRGKSLALPGRLPFAVTSPGRRR